MRADDTRALSGCLVVSLRPVGGHGALRRAVARRGGALLALSPWRLVAADDVTTRDALAGALAADRVVFTSPAAVRAAHALAPLRALAATGWLGVGRTTARALARAGVDGANWPSRMDSEGLLALPALADVRGQRVGLVTAPGGRAHLAESLAAAGAAVIRADVYRRDAIAPSPRAVARLAAHRGLLLLLLSSGQALESVDALLPAAARSRLRQATVVAASARLAALARAHGFAVATVAASARPQDLLAAAEAARAGVSRPPPSPPASASAGAAR